jgi:hypothetical protein
MKQLFGSACVCPLSHSQPSACIMLLCVYEYTCAYIHTYTYIYVCIHTIHASTHKLNNASVQERACACLRCSGEARACIIHSSAHALYILACIHYDCAHLDTRIKKMYASTNNLNNAPVRGRACKLLQLW